jgi:hypothetical protein
MSTITVCRTKQLPADRWLAAADLAVSINPANRPAIEHLPMVTANLAADPALISVLTTKYWHTKGVHLTVAFLDNPPAALRKKIVSHMNAWNRTANVTFVQTQGTGQVRISRVVDDGHWSYHGTDILTIDADEATMNLDSFTMQTPDSEFFRVVRHETGHTLGFPHEHMRRELVNKIDVHKAIAFFKVDQGWSESMTRQQVLTPIEERSIRGTAHADPNSIMCYQLPGTITKDGKPIPGGNDIDKSYYDFVALIYPKASPRKTTKRTTKKLAKSGAKRGMKKTAKRAAKRAKRRR